jgi:hypothetical protein
LTKKIWYFCNAFSIGESQGYLIDTICTADQVVRKLFLIKKDGGYKLDADPLKGKANCKVKCILDEFPGFNKSEGVTPPAVPGFPD